MNDGRLNELMRNTDPHGTTDLEVLDPGDPTAAEAQAAFATSERIKRNLRQTRAIWYRIAEDLYRFHKLQMWRDLGLASFEEWLAQPEIQIGRRTVFAMVEVWRELVVERGVPPHELADVPSTNLRDTLSAVRRGMVQPGEAIADAKSLSRDDLRERYEGLVVLDQKQRGTFDPTAEPRYARCPSCGQRYRVKEAA